MNSIIHILHLEDNTTDAKLIKSRLKKAGVVCRINRVQTSAEFNNALRKNKPDVILADYWLTKYDGMSALRRAQALCPDVPFIFISSTKGEEAVIKALTQGAADYVLKENMVRLKLVIKRAMQKAKDRWERKQVEEAYRIKMNRFEELFNKAAIPLCFVNKETEALNFNAQFEKTFGYSKEEVPTLREWWPLTYPDPDYRKWVIDTCYSELERAATTNTDIKPIEYNVTSKNGDIHTMVVYGSFIGDDLLLTFFDITERKRAEEALREAEVRYRTVADFTYDWEIWENPDNTFRYVSPSCERITGYTAKKFMDNPGLMNQLILPEDRKIWDRHLHDSSDKAGLREIQFRIRRSDEEIRWIEHACQPVTDQQGAFLGYRGSNRDITERKHAEEEHLANLHFLESMDQVNRAIQGTNDIEQMMRDVLDVVLSIYDCDRAFLLYPCDPNASSWHAPMERTKPEYPGASAMRLEVSMDPDVARVYRLLLESDGPVKFGPDYIHPLPQKMSKLFGYKSQILMALYPKKGGPWIFGLHQCSYQRVWTYQEEKLFQEIGRRLADSLTSLLMNRNLKESENQYRELANSITDVFFAMDIDLKYTYWNKASENLIGIKAEDAIGKTIFEIFPDTKETKKAAAVYQEVLKKKQPTSLENEYQLEDKHYFFEINAYPTRDGISVFAKDITERKQAEESIRKLSLAIEQSPVSIVITDTDGSIEFVNSKFTQITGYTYDEAIGKNPRILKSGETSDEEYSNLWKTISSGGVWEGEFQNRKKNGELFWEYVTIAPVKNKDNVITHYVAVKEDITERKKLEEQFRQSQKMEAVGQLAGGVAHDFNNMLVVIIGHAEVALENAALDASLREDLNQILTAGYRSAEIIRQLLAFARKQTIVPKIIDLNKIVDGMLKLLKRLIGEDIELIWVPGANLWSVIMDPAQVDQILANLFVNARDAISGIGKVTIETKNVYFDDAYCTAHKGFIPGEYVMLAVSDNGRGMDKTTMDKIFEPFFTTKGIGRGTGLGLSTVYGIVKQNTGFINVHSKPGHGSTFRIYLPRHAIKTKQIRKRNLLASNFQRSETILLVEDELSVLNMVKQMLEKFKYKVLTSLNPKVAIRLARKNSGEIDLLITDIVMPGMTGLDLMKKLKSIYPKIKCLFISGYTNDIIDNHGVLFKSVNFIQKPFSIQELAAKVREVLDNK